MPIVTNIFYCFGHEHTIGLLLLEWIARISTKLCHLFGSVSYLKTQSKIWGFSPSKIFRPRTAYFRQFYDDIYARISSERNAL